VGGEALDFLDDRNGEEEGGPYQVVWDDLGNLACKEKGDP
jgi:hypothetical protein